MTRPRRQLATVLGISGAAGFALGAVYADLQWAVEHAQVLAGVVTYPPGDPTGVIQAGPWSLISQLAAIALWLGVSEPLLCWLLSGLLGMLSCQAIATLVFALSGRAWFSIGALFVIIASRAVDWGVAYPIALFGTAHTYGVAGLSLTTLALALAAAGAWRPAVFLAAMSIGAHASHGLFLWLVLGSAWAVEAARSPESARIRLRQSLVPLASGLAIVMMSFVAHQQFVPAPPVIDGDTGPYLRAFVRHWDMHRQPIRWSEGAVRIVLGLLIIAVGWLRLSSNRTSPSVRYYLSAAAIAAGLGLLAVAATQIPPEAQPRWLIQLMPGRLLNVALILAVPTLLGLSGGLSGRPGVIMPILFVSLLLASKRSLVWSALFDVPFGASETGVDQLAMLGLMSAGILFHAYWLHRAEESRLPIPAVRASRVFRVLLAGVMAGAVVVSGILARRELGRRGHVWRNYASEDVFAAAQSELILIGGSAWMIQLRTRTPLLLDVGTLDVLPYQAWAFPHAASILREVCQVDLLSPPPGFVREGRLPPDACRTVWEKYTREDWARLRRKFGITTVVTDAGWQLSLPSRMTGRGLGVFAID